MQEVVEEQEVPEARAERARRAVISFLFFIK